MTEADLFGPAVGVFEAEGFVAVFNATEAMAKAANVDVGGLVSLGSGLVAVTLGGDLASVRAAMDVGEQTVRATHALEARTIIFPNPCPAVVAVAARPGQVG